MKSSHKTPDFVLAVERFQQKLLQQEFACAQPIRESVLAKEFGVTRPAMREALCQAIGWGVVEYVPYCGYRIKDFTIKELADWSVYRESIEGTAVRLLTQRRDQTAIRRLEELLEAERKALMENDTQAATKADSEFHMTIVGSSGNSRLEAPSSFCFPLRCFRSAHAVIYDCFIQMVRLLQENGHEPQVTSEEQKRLGNEMTIVQHRDILEAIKYGDWQLSEAILRGHIRVQSRNYELLLKVLGDPGLTISQLENTGKYMSLMAKADWARLVEK